MLGITWKYCILLVLLITPSLIRAQVSKVDYEDYPLIKFHLTLNGSKDLKALVNLGNEGQLLNSTLSDRSYILESFVDNKPALPEIHYYGLLRLENGSLGAIKCDSGYYDSIQIAYKELIEALASIPPATTHIQEPDTAKIITPTTITDTLHIYAHLRDSKTKALALGAYFDLMILQTPEGQEYRLEIPPEADIIRDTILAESVSQNIPNQATIPDSSLTVTSGKPTNPISDLYLTDKSLEEILQTIQAPAIIYVAQKDTFARRIAKEGLERKDLHGKQLASICTGKNINKVHRGLIDRIESEQQIEAILELMCFQSESRFKQKDNLLIPLRKGDSLHLSIDVPDRVLQEYFTENLLQEIEDYMIRKDYAGGISLLNSKRQLCLENGMGSETLDSKAPLLFKGFFQTLSEEGKLMYDTLVAFEELWTGPIPGSFSKDVRVEAYNKEFGAAFDTRDGQALVYFFQQWSHRIPESNLHGTQPGKLSYSRYLINKSKNWQESCKQLQIAKDRGYSTLSADQTFCRNKEILSKRSLMAQSYSNKDFKQVYSIGIQNKSLYENSPEHRLILAESAWETGNMKDAYKHYLWFDKNWNSMPADQMDYDSYLELIGKLAFTNGDLTRAFQLCERNYMNSSNRKDLDMVVNVQRTLYIDLILNLYLQVKNTKHGPLLPYYTRYKPDYMEEVREHPAGHKPSLGSGDPLLTYPANIFDVENNRVRSIGKISNGKMIEFTQRSGQYEGDSKALVNRLLQAGYDANTLTRLQRNEKKISMEFFGKTFKSLIGDLYSHSANDFEAEIKALLKSESIYQYMEYSIDDKITRLGECPPKEAYQDASYLDILPRIIDYETTSLSIEGQQFDEIVVPLKENGKKIGYIRIGLKTGEL